MKWYWVVFIIFGSLIVLGIIKYYVISNQLIKAAEIDYQNQVK